MVRSTDCADNGRLILAGISGTDRLEQLETGRV